MWRRCKGGVEEVLGMIYVVGVEEHRTVDLQESWICSASFSSNKEPLLQLLIIWPHVSTQPHMVVNTGSCPNIGDT